MLKNKSIESKRLRWAALLSIVAALILRLVCLDVMEWKEDEQFNFQTSQSVGTTQPWPWYGIGSGVYIPNPGMSVWVFAALAKLFRANTPTELQRALGIFSVFGIALFFLFAWKWIKEKSERWAWILGASLALVNPFHVWYERKLWPEGFLPFFAAITFMGWWYRSRMGWAFVWGFFCTIIGQVHMSGFFFGAALFIWTLLFGKKLSREAPTLSGSALPHWPGFWFGVIVGFLPLIPWLQHILAHPTGQSVGSGWGEVWQLKYWVFWFTDPTGLHLGNTLGLLRSQSVLGQISDFIRYPLLGESPTYLCGMAHLGIVLVLILSLWKNRIQSRSPIPWRTSSFWLGTKSPTQFLVSALFLGCGLLLTLTSVRIRRYYMAVTTPLEFVFLLSILGVVAGRIRWRWWFFLWLCELTISACFIHYIVVNEGAPQGDYGTSYRKQVLSQPTN